MVNLYDVSALILNDLNNINGIKTYGLGLERGIGAKDAPFIRVVPVSARNGENDRVTLTIDVFIGSNTKNDFDKEYQDHFLYETIIKERLHLAQYSGGVCHYVSTVTDSDTIMNLKATVITFEVRGLLNYG